MAIFPIVIILNCYLQGNWENLYKFILFAIFGVIGETLFSLWWFSYFKKRFWTYSVETYFNKFTSFLNFIPWGVGGLIYSSYLPNYVNRVEVTKWFLVLFPLLCIVQALVYFIYKKKSWILFFSPIITFSILIAFKVENSIYLVMLFSIIPTLAEYLFGKATELLISRKLWVYNFMSYDRGHFTPLSIPAFLLAGFYFLTIEQVFGFTFALW